MTNNNPICWVEIYVDDLARAQKFYEGVFQVRLSPISNAEKGLEMLAFPNMKPDNAGAAVALAKMKGVAAGTGGTLVYFSCEDCANEAARVVECGGTLIHEKFSVGEFGFLAIAGDSEGNTIGLHSTA